MPRHYYKHAPIVEAIIDLRAAQPKAISQDDLNSFSESLKDCFPTVKDINVVTMGFHKGAGAVPDEFNSQHERVGLRLENSKADRVLQVQRMGFTYSHLPPYSDWITFRQEAKPLWSRYRDMTGISHVARLAVRVINKIPLPASIAELPRYSHLVAHLPKNIPGVPEAFFTQIQLNGGTWFDGSRVLVNAGVAPQPDGKAELLLDFDIFVEAREEARSQEIWDILDQLNSAKDDLFEACITDETRRLIA